MLSICFEATVRPKADGAERLEPKAMLISDSALPLSNPRIKKLGLTPGLWTQERSFLYSAAGWRQVCDHAHLVLAEVRQFPPMAGAVPEAD